MLLPAVQPRRPAMDDRTMPAPRHDRCFRTGCAVALHNLPTNSDHDEVSQAGATAGGDLSFHGDAELAPGLVDLAVNVRHEPRPAWLTAAILDAVEDLSHYPDDGPARQAVADRHGRSVDEVLITAGAAQGRLPGGPGPADRGGRVPPRPGRRTHRCRPGRHR